MANPSLTLTLDDLVVGTAESYIRTMPADVIFEDNLLLGALFRADQRPGTGGEAPPAFRLPAGRFVRRNARELWIPTAYQRSTNTQAYTHADTLPVNIDPVYTTQRSNYAYYTDLAGLTRQEYKENGGSPEMMVDLMKARIDMVNRTSAETLEGNLWSANDGSATNPKQVQGLQHLLANDATTGTVWGLNRATYTWHRHNSINASSASFASAGMGHMRTMFTNCAGTGGVDRPSVIVTTSALWNAFSKEAEDIQQITHAHLADLGYDTLTWRRIPITYSDQCLAGAMYWMNLRYWVLATTPGPFFESEEQAKPANQALWKLMRIFFDAQWGCERYDRQGVIYGFSDT